MFCTANFLNFLPWQAALRLLSDVGIDTVSGYVSRLVDHLVDRLDRDRYELVSPSQRAERSALVVVRRRDGRTDQAHRRLGEHGVDAALREGSIRLSPHLFDTSADLERALDVLHAPGP